LYWRLCAAEWPGDDRACGAEQFAAQLLIAVNGPTGGGTTYGLVSSLILN